MVGLGRMGLPIVARLVAAGFEVIVFDVQVAAIDEARGIGALAAADAEEAASGVNVLVTVLPGANEVLEAMLGSDGLLQNMQAGSCWLDLTSNDPRVARQVSDAAELIDVQSVGAPMGGNPAAAAAGTLNFFVGGPATAIDCVRLILRALSQPRDLIVIGPEIEDGYVAKLLANTLWFGQVAAVTEALLLGQRLGIDVRSLREVLVRSAGGSVFLSNQLDALLRGDYLTTFGIDRVVEELDTVLSLADTAQTPVDLTSAVTALHRQALEHFGPVDGELLAAKLLEYRAGTTLRIAEE